MKRLLFSLSVLLLAASCSNTYKVLPFGGMNGKVESVITTHIMPEVWQAGRKKTDVMYTNSLAYDPFGNEICSELRDSTGKVQIETENIFQNGICVLSTQTSENMISSQIRFVEKKGRTMKYISRSDGKSCHMDVRERSLGRSSRSAVSEDGKVVSISVIRTDMDGYPVSVRITDRETGVTTVEKNTYDGKHNIIEKHSTSSDSQKEEITYTDYLNFDENGNWTEARTYNKYRLPVEILVREIKYWN